jgi:glycosyltransferase involved in cell wall biosynthesis
MDREKNTVWGVSMVRNEEDIIGYTLSHMIASGMDGLVVSDNLSNDGTRKILYTMALTSKIPIVIVDDKDEGYRQSQKMTALAKIAKDHGASWIVPFDADELWYPYMVNGVVNLGDAIRNSCHPVIGVPVWHHFDTGLDDLSDKNPFTRMRWRQGGPASISKVCFKWFLGVTIWQGNHGIWDINQRPVPGENIGIGIRHMPYRGADRLIKKSIIGAAAYAAAPELNPDFGLHWREYGRIIAEGGEEAGRELYHRLFYFENPGGSLIYDPAPYRGERK